jgi:TonB family protein
MKKTGKINKLFLPDGCLTGFALEHFLAGDLNKSNRQLVEQHLATCEMCRDAVEGYRSEHIQVILDDLNEKIQSRITNVNKNKIDDTLTHRKIIPYISLAASLILLVGLFFMFRKITNMHTKLIAEQKEEQVTTSPAEKKVMHEKKTMVPKEKNTPPAISGQKVITKGNGNLELKKPATEVPVAPGRKSASEQQIVSESIQSQSLKVLNDVETESSDKIIVTAKTSGNAMATPALAKKEKLSQQEKIQQMTNKNISSYQEVFNAEAAEEPVFVVVENQPSFEGGDLNTFVAYIQKHLKYPPEAAQSGIEGKIFISFIVDSTGNVADIRVLRGVDSLLDKEAVRVISHSPQWKPGFQRGKPVNVQFTVPVNFKLDRK